MPALGGEPRISWFHRTFLTNCLAALRIIKERVSHKDLGRQTGSRPSMEHVGPTGTRGRDLQVSSVEQYLII